MSTKPNNARDHVPFPGDLQPHKLLSRDEVATVYGIAKRFLEIAACKGDGPVFVKVGRLARYRVQDIEDWINRNRFSNTSAADLKKGRK